MARILSLVSFRGLKRTLNKRASEIPSAGLFALFLLHRLLFPALYSQVERLKFFLVFAHGLFAEITSEAKTT